MFGFLGKCLIVGGIAYGAYLAYYESIQKGLAVGVLLFALGSFIIYMGGLFDGE